MAVALAPGDPIPWKDAAMATGMAALRELPGGAEAYDRLGCELLAALHLLAANMDTEKALETIRQTGEWRQTSGAAAARLRLIHENLQFQDYPHTADISAFMPLHESAKNVTRGGMTFAIRCPGMSDAEGLFAKVSEQEMLDWQLFVSEGRLLILEAHARREGRLFHMTVVQDLSCPIGFLNLYRQNSGKQYVVSRISHAIDTHYPEMFDKVLLTSAPWGLQTALNLASPLIPKRIFEKLEVVPAPDTGARMRELVEPSRLPRFLGGDVSDKDFMPSRAACAEGASEEVVVAAGKVDERGVPMEEGRTVAYGFAVDGDGPDIQFAVRFEAEGGGASDIQQVKTPELVKEITGGIFTAPKRGRLVLVFSNQHGWWGAKTIRFECKELPVQEGQARSVPAGDGEDRQAEPAEALGADQARSVPAGDGEGRQAEPAEAPGADQARSVPAGDGEDRQAEPAEAPGADQARSVPAGDGEDRQAEPAEAPGADQADGLPAAAGPDTRKLTPAVCVGDSEEGRQAEQVGAVGADQAPLHGAEPGAAGPDRKFTPAVCAGGEEERPSRSHDRHAEPVTVTAPGAD